MTLKEQSAYIIRHAIQSVLPDEAVKTALAGDKFKSLLSDGGKLYMVAIGKAAWQMAEAAAGLLGERLYKGIVLTKYDHVKDATPRVECLEAGHPVPDANSFVGTQKILDMTNDLEAKDVVLFLISGGGSALFEKPLVSEEELESVTRQLLGCGAGIEEINTIRKRLSAVKGGRFAKHCAPAKVFSIVLSDIIGDPLDMIASGPAYADQSTCEEAMQIADKYKLELEDSTRALLKKETPKELDNVDTIISGSVSALCKAAREACEALGYETVLLTDRMDCEAKEAGSFLASIGKTQHLAHKYKNLAFIAGGETVVHLQGNGKGGRNQELALSAAIGLDGVENVALFSVGSDGTDGPTDAAGGYVDTMTCENLKNENVNIEKELANNNAYEALEKCDGLVKTGPTGTNVNDVSVVLCKAAERFEFRNIRPEEAAQAAEIERICFPPNEACSEKNMNDRVRDIPDLFLVVEDKETGKLAGFLNGLATNEPRLKDEFFTDASLHDPNGKNIMLLGLDVLPEYRKQGLARQLVATYLKREKEKGRSEVILTCLDAKVEMYEKFGFKDLGISDSSWGGEEWHEMSVVLEAYE